MSLLSVRHEYPLLVIDQEAMHRLAESRNRL